MTPSSRPTLDATFMANAKTWALRSTCSHLAVGAVLARDGHDIAAGYNGAPPSLQHCEHDDRWPRERCTNTVHAEGNAIAHAARHGHATLGSTLYCTHSPCKACAGLLISAGIVRVVFESMYLTDKLGEAGLTWLRDAGVVIEELPE